MSYIFRQIKKEEVSEMFQLILKRIEWMNQKGIELWNTTNYVDVFPQSYFEEKRQQGEVYVLVDNDTNEIVSAAVLSEEDDFWDDHASAIYLHNFVSKLGCKNVGTVFIEYAEEYAKSKNKQYFRLDSAINSDFLTRYYESLGFIPVGYCEEGLYKGICRQKELKYIQVEARIYGDY